MNQEFKVHLLNEEGKERAKKIAEAFDVLLETLKNLTIKTSSENFDEVSYGRSFSIAKTKLEEACFFAKKEMAEKFSE